MATTNPMKGTYPNSPPTVSKKTFTISGILTTVHGLEDLPAEATNVTCLWLLHPRLQTQTCMEPVAASAITDWNHQPKAAESAGLLAASFDQRNHGSREVNKLANETWRSGNESHAQDMLGIYHGTATDVSQLMTYISSYTFPTSDRKIVDHIVLGVSLGGHAAWQCVVHEARVSTAIVIIGCPDYVALMSDRARLSKLPSRTNSKIPGAQFLGSKDFPLSLVKAVEKVDPAGLFLGPLRTHTSQKYDEMPSQDEQKRLVPLMSNTLQGKRILNMAGGADKLVPYKCAEPFCRWLKKATASNGWFADRSVHFENIIYDGVGHDMSPEMAKEANRFIIETLMHADKIHGSSKI